MLLGKSRLCQIGGLKPQVEVYALMTARDDWAVSVSQECVLSAPQTLKKADEWLFGVCMYDRQRRFPVYLVSFIERDPNYLSV